MTKRETFNGPTDQRLTMADGHVAIGDDKQGKRVYHFLDCCLDRVYSSLSRKAGASDQAQLGAEYAALTRFQRYYCDAGLMGSVGSVDYNSLGTNIASGRTFLAATERQINARDEEVAGYAIGRKSRTRAVDTARTVLRGAGAALAELWGIAANRKDVA